MNPRPPVTTHTAEEKSRSGPSPRCRDCGACKDRRHGRRRVPTHGRCGRAPLVVSIDSELAGDARHASPRSVEQRHDLPRRRRRFRRHGFVAGRPGTTVLDDFEPIALKAAVHDHAGYRAVQADINQLPHAERVRCRAVCDRALPPDEPRPSGGRQRVRPRHQARRCRVPDGAGREAAVARSRRCDPHRPPIQPRPSCARWCARQASTSSAQLARTPSWFRLRQ